MIDLNAKKFEEKATYNAYNPNNIYKCNSNNLKQVLEGILRQNSNERILIELPNTIGLTNDIIDSLTDNIDVRIIGGLTEEYANSHKNEYMDYLREKATYSKDELKKIMSKINEIEANIDPKWNSYEKALYLYEYIKYSIVYRKPEEKYENEQIDLPSNISRTRTWDTLTGLINQISTCSGFAHIYQELCTRQNISCVKVGGKYVTGREGSHAWNIVTIDGNNHLVDIIWDTMEYEKGRDITTGFAVKNISPYRPKSYRNLHENLLSISENWIKETSKNVSVNIPKEQIFKERIEHFLKIRKIDRERMMYLINNEDVNTIESRIVK